eukprot:2782803-Prymnesium_polylepis.1
MAGKATVASVAERAAQSGAAASSTTHKSRGLRDTAHVVAEEGAAVAERAVREANAAHRASAA